MLPGVVTGLFYFSRENLPVVVEASVLLCWGGRSDG